jgi:hypothetical protein
MPYIPQDRRDVLDPFIAILANTLKTMGGSKGNLVYVLYELALAKLEPSFDTISERKDALLCAADEVKRRILDPYEDYKIEWNGDTPCAGRARTIIQKRDRAARG